MLYIKTVIITVGTSQISKERKPFLGKTVKELLSIKFIPQGYLKKMKQISPIITKAIAGLLRTPTQGRFYLLEHPCFSISLSQQPGTAEYT